MIDQADDLRKLLSSSSKAANAPLAEEKSAECEVNKKRGVRGARCGTRRTTHNCRDRRTHLFQRPEFFLSPAVRGE